MSEITDQHIRLMKASASISEAIELIQKTLGELTKFECDIRVKRAMCEAALGEMIAKKLLVEQAQRGL